MAIALFFCEMCKEPMFDGDDAYRVTRRITGDVLYVCPRCSLGYGKKMKVFPIDEDVPHGYGREYDSRHERG